jgi:uncharacterized membrane protein YkvA (DUF1232 family)
MTRASEGWARWALERAQLRAKTLKAETWALYLAYRNPRTPWYARLFALCVVGYALSPIDLIPDFVPVLGYIDDLVLVPLGIVLALKMIPKAVMDECREQAGRDLALDKPTHWVAAGIIVSVWLLLAAAVIALLLRWIR